MGIVIVYHPKVLTDDLKKIGTREKFRIQKAIESKLAVSPLLYGEPLRGQLTPLWKLRVGDYRIVFHLTGDEALYIHTIGHRSTIYAGITTTRERLL